MTFIDDLSLITDLLILVPCLVFYTGFTVWLNVRQKDLPRAQAHLREGGIMLGIVGVIIGIFAIWGETTWPLAVNTPAGNVLASYDLFFFDMLVLLSVLLVAFGVTVALRLPTHFVGMMAVVTGFGVGFYAYRGYTMTPALTLDPLQTFLLYLAFGGMAIFSYPATLFVDWFVVGPTKPESSPLASDPTPRAQYRWMWIILLGIFLGVVVLAGIAAVWYGFDIGWAHLAAPP
jgi:uncharacterized membrane protein